MFALFCGSKMLRSSACNTSVNGTTGMNGVVERVVRLMVLRLERTCKYVSIWCYILLGHRDLRLSST